MAPTDTNEPATERSFAHYVDLLRRRWILVAVPAIVAAVLGGIVAAQEPDSYAAQSTVRVGDPSLPSDLFGSGTDDIDQLLGTAIQVIDSDPLRDEVLAAVSDDAEAAFKDVSVSRVEETVLVDIDVTAETPDAAMEIAQTWAETYVSIETDRTVGALNQRAEEIRSQISDIETQLQVVNAAIAEEAASIAAQGTEAPVVITGDETPTLSGLTQERDDLLGEQSRLRERANELEVEAALRSSMVEVAFPADDADGPYGGSPVRTAGVAGVLGALLGAGLAVAREELDDRIYDTQTLERTQKGVPILAAVPGSLRRGLRHQSPVVALDADDSRAEAFRTMRTNLEFILAGRPKSQQGRVVMVTSPLNSEGKSTTAATLAATLVSLGRSVVLIDADLRRGTLHQQFGARQSPGLLDVLVDEQPLDSAMQPVELKEGFFFLLAGGRHLSPGELFALPRFDRVVQDLAEVSDYVIIDAPPVLAVSDALELGRVCDGAVMIVGAGRTRQPQLRKAMDSVRQLDIAILGFVLNGVGKSDHGYYEYTDTPSRRRRVPATNPFGSRNQPDSPLNPSGDPRGDTGEDDVDDDRQRPSPLDLWSGNTEVRDHSAHDTELGRQTPR